MRDLCLVVSFWIKPRQLIQKPLSDIRIDYLFCRSLLTLPVFVKPSESTEDEGTIALLHQVLLTRPLMFCIRDGFSKF